VLGGALLAAACSSKAPEVDNAASRNCVDRGGQVRVENEGFGDFGLCAFEGNRQCEQWALLRGECPRGGIPVAQYSTPFERYCAIRGGSLVKGTCALPPAGTYVARLRGERTATLALDMQGSAVLAMPSPGRTLRGQWERRGGFLTVFSGKEQIVFRYEGQRLVPNQWDRDTWRDPELAEFRRQ
jgi:putative hemolysin